MNKFLLALSIIGLTASHAIAETSFATVDENQDGMVTLVEANAAGLPWTQEQFSSVDKDQNGLLDADEFAVAVQ